jgi:Na+/melibiose symporter-like transporter
VLDDFLLALRNRDYRLLVLASLTAYAVVGADGSLNIYMSTYFWGFLPEDLRWFAIAAIGSLIAFVGVTPLQRRVDKRRLVMGCVLFLLVDGITIITLRFLDVLPANGDPRLLVILVANAVAVATALTTGGIMFTSMVADLLDAQEHQTGRRQEGMFSAALSFASKATSGLGVLIGGLILQHAIAFPVGVRPDAVEGDIVDRLGLWAGIVLPLFYLVPLGLISRYRLTRDVHAGIQRDLAERRAANGSS